MRALRIAAMSSRTRTKIAVSTLTSMATMQAAIAGWWWIKDRAMRICNISFLLSRPIKPPKEASDWQASFELSTLRWVDLALLESDETL